MLKMLRTISLVMMALLGVTGCSPDPKNVQAPERLIVAESENGEGAGRVVGTTILPETEYEESSVLFTLFLWPTDSARARIKTKGQAQWSLLTTAREVQKQQARLARLAELEANSELAMMNGEELFRLKEERDNYELALRVSSELRWLQRLSDVTALVGKESTILDQIYTDSHELLLQRDQLQNEKSARAKEFEDAVLVEAKDFFQTNYSCLLGEDGESGREVCLRAAQVGDDPSKLKIPEACSELKRKPLADLFKSRESECRQVYKERFTQSAVEQRFKEQYGPLVAKYEAAELAVENFQLDFKVRRQIEFIMRAVEPDYNLVDDKLNFMDTTYNNCRLNVDRVSGQVDLQFSLRINNLQPLGPGQVRDFSNRELFYKSGIDGDIVEAQMIVENEVPALKLKFLEKRATSATTEARTGFFMEAILRQSVSRFGLTYLGKLSRYNARGERVAQGMVKMIFQERRSEQE